MRLVLLFAGAAILVLWGGGTLIGRRWRGLGSWLALAGALVARLVLVGVFGSLTVRTAERGSWWLLLTALLALLCVFSAGFAVLMLWALGRRDVDSTA